VGTGAHTDGSDRQARDTAHIVVRMARRVKTAQQPVVSTRAAPQRFHDDDAQALVGSVLEIAGADLLLHIDETVLELTYAMIHIATG